MTLAGEPEEQFHWHETFRDHSKNMYRTSYSDMSNGREVAVKSDLPSGYGGHVPSVHHDVLFRNSAFDRECAQRRQDPTREAFPHFQDQISGIPTFTQRPRGAKKIPVHGTIPHNGTTTMLRPPWGIVTAQHEPLHHRTTPRTMTRPTLATMTTLANEAARKTGSSGDMPLRQPTAAPTRVHPEDCAELPEEFAHAEAMAEVPSDARPLETRQQGLMTPTGSVRGVVLGSSSDMGVMEAPMPMTSRPMYQGSGSGSGSATPMGSATGMPMEVPMSARRRQSAGSGSVTPSGSGMGGGSFVEVPMSARRRHQSASGSGTPTGSARGVGFVEGPMSARSRGSATPLGSSAGGYEAPPMMMQSRRRSASSNPPSSAGGYNATRPVPGGSTTPSSARWDATAAPSGGHLQAMAEQGELDTEHYEM